MIETCLFSREPRALKELMNFKGNVWASSTTDGTVLRFPAQTQYHKQTHTFTHLHTYTADWYEMEDNAPAEPVSPSNSPWILCNLFRSKPVLLRLHKISYKPTCSNSHVYMSALPAADFQHFVGWWIWFFWRWVPREPFFTHSAPMSEHVSLYASVCCRSLSQWNVHFDSISSLEPASLKCFNIAQQM